VRYLLDTNTCIEYINGRSTSVRQHLHALHPDDIAVCAPVKADLFYGAARSADPPRTLAALQAFFSPYVSLPFDDAAAEAYGRIRADLATRGTLIGPNDLLIAAIAVTSGLTLVTHNTGEFSRVAGLPLEDWEVVP
jgi:tRNA(fMet)-specific endonuclease VapC